MTYDIMQVPRTGSRPVVAHVQRIQCAHFSLECCQLLYMVSSKENAILLNFRGFKNDLWNAVNCTNNQIINEYVHDREGLMCILLGAVFELSFQTAMDTGNDLVQNNVKLAIHMNQTGRFGVGISLLCKSSYCFWYMKLCVWFTHRKPNMP